MDATNEQPEILETPAVGTEPEQPELDEDAKTLEDAHLSETDRRLRWQARRPRILHLEEGVARTLGDPDERGFRRTELVPLFDVGDRIVVDCCTKLLRPWTNDHGVTVYPWLQTLVGKVRSIDDETGVVSLYDEESDPRNPMVRWVSFRDGLHDFRLAPARGNPFNVILAKQAERAAKIAAAAADPNAPKKRGRGRPKGSRNRSKEEIAAEREAYRKAREERRRGSR